MRAMTLLACFALFGLAACSGASSNSDGGSTGGGAGGGGGGSDGGVGISPDGGALPAGAIELTSLEVKVTGLRGQDVRFTVQGSDEKSDAVLLQIELLDAAGKPLAAFDTNEDGTLDALDGPLPLEDLKWTGTKFTAIATLRGVAKSLPTLDRATVTLVDALDNRSAGMSAHVGKPTVQPLGAPCDPTYVVARCGDGLSCRGTPATCQAGVAPTITRLAFLTSAKGPQILIEGTELEDDLTNIAFGFQSAQGQPIAVDGDGDGTPELSSFDYQADGASVNGSFFVRLQPADGLAGQVPRLTATPSDAEGHVGSMKTAAPQPVPTRSSGQSCDARGFDQCGANLACTPGLVGKANSCQSAPTQRKNQCAAAPLIEPTTGGVTARGYAAGGSLWDTPTGCQTNDPTSRPEGLVRLHLSAQASKLTLSTEHPGTTFDTALYLLPGCPDGSLTSLGCRDDVAPGNPKSRLEVLDVPPGDYLVVVDSFGYEGGLFELTAKVE
jgi:hypothetical protein